jgi:exopolysaccharide biosynthesis WecB/TagA/CpsF family protein
VPSENPPPDHGFPTIEFLSLPLVDCGHEGLIRHLVDADPATVRPRAVAYLNAHTANLASRRDGSLRELMPRMDLLYADGMSVVRAARRHRAAFSERVSAGDFLPEFCRAAAARHRRIALVGSTAAVVEGCAAALCSMVPNLNVVLAHDGFLDDGQRRAELLAKLGELRPDIVLLGMGSPRQESLALVLRDELRLPTTWCVGALFEYFAPGSRSRAPKWMRSAGLEWAWRLALEPRRLAGRYLLGNIEFILRTRGFLR